MAILVDQVRIHNFRSLRDVEISLSPITILVGMNNAGKTSFLKALHLALGDDRRIIGGEDFFAGNPASESSGEILIDVRIIPVDSGGARVDEFEGGWTNTDFGGELVCFDQDDRQFVAVRTRIQYEAARHDFIIRRFALAGWRGFASWLETAEKGPLRLRFEQLVIFLIDAQRDIAGDLRSRTSYLGRLLAKIETSPEETQEIEAQLRKLNAQIVDSSDVLSHLREIFGKLNRTITTEGQGVEITPVSKSLPDITRGLDVQFRDNDTAAFPLDYHGMGTRSWASLLAYQAYVLWLARQADSEMGLPFHPVLALEEPEAHLHPNAQRQLYGQLREAIGQKVISTHSPYIAAQANLGEIRHFHKDNAETKVAALNISTFEKESLRKIEREVMNTRGELLFARAVILFEGETEEQALPIFAKAFWDREPFTLGLAFIGVGGGGNYLPFLRVADALRVNWFIFSDGEEKARTKVERALAAIDVNLSDVRLTILPFGMSIEQYLLTNGYEDELKESVIKFQEPTFANARHAEAKRTEIMRWSNDDILVYLKSWKTKISPHWAREISSLSDQRRFPPKVHELLTKVAHSVTNPPEADDER